MDPEKSWVGRWQGICARVTPPSPGVASVARVALTRGDGCARAARRRS